MNIQSIVKESQGGKFTFSLQALLREVHYRTTSTGSPYADVVFADYSGQVTSKAWSDSYLYAFINKDNPVGKVFSMLGFAEQGKYGLNLAVSSLVPLNAEETENFYLGDPKLVKAAKENFDIVKNVVKTLEDLRLKGVCEWAINLLSRDRLWIRAAASKKGPYSGMGGLVGRMAKVIGFVNGLCSGDATLNRDLLVAGAVMSDLGRTVTTVHEDGGLVFDVSVASELSEHTAVSARLLEQAWSSTRLEFDEELWQKSNPEAKLVLEHMRHMVLSHQGKTEYGAFVKPKTPEAEVLASLDALVHRLSLFEETYLTSPEVDAKGRIHEWNRLLEVSAVKPLESCKGI